MIEVVHVITSLETGGAQRMLEKLLEKMDRARFRSRVVSLIAGGAVAERLAGQGIEVCALGMRRGVPDPRAILRLRKRLAEWRPHVLQTWLYHADLVGALSASAARPALAWNVRCSAQAKETAGFRKSTAVRLCARLSHRPDVIVTNSSAGRVSHERIGYRARRWVRIPNGFDLARYRPDPERRRALRGALGIPADAVLAGMLARFHPLKGHALFLQAGARLARELSAPLQLVCAGEGATLENPAFAALVRAAGAEGVTLALGERHDVPELLAALDFLVLPSDTESFPNVLGEALACGLPCLATTVGDSAEIVGEAGILCAPGDLAALSAGLARLGRMPRAERTRLGRLGRARVEAHYELGVVARAYEALYTELAGSR